MAGTFRTPPQCSERTQLKISCYATKGKERGKSARIVKRRDPENIMDAVHSESRTWGFPLGTAMEKEGDGKTGKGKVV
jgi:hypothetical protein